MKRSPWAAAAALLLALPAHASLHALIIGGLGGEPEYERAFFEQARDAAAAAAKVSNDSSRVALLSGTDASRDAVLRALRALAMRVQAGDQVAVLLIGHGSFDGDEYRLNLPGPDLTGSELAAQLDRLAARDQLVVNATSSSGALLERLKRPGRVVITATRSGVERNATRFARFWIQALTSAEADRDKNELVTAAEAYEFAERKVADSYKTEVIMATEHAQIDGNNAARFLVARLGDVAGLPPGAELSSLMDERAAIETQLGELRGRKASMESEAYYADLEKILVSLARLQRRIDGRPANDSATRNDTDAAPGR